MKTTFAARTVVAVDARFNGHRAQVVWNDSPQQTDFAWHGAIVTVSFHRKAGPAVVRIANARPRAVRVRVDFSW
jgi:nucleoside-specific outer membrane channel protein Tsx